jgi:hypothetical protein
MVAGGLSISFRMIGFLCAIDKTGETRPRKAF